MRKKQNKKKNLCPKCGHPMSMEISFPNMVTSIKTLLLFECQKCGYTESKWG
jgi:ribosomal protein L37E